jgi:hypothetical protein
MVGSASLARSFDEPKEIADGRVSVNSMKCFDQEREIVDD